MKKLTSLILTICMLSALFAPLSVLPASAATSGTTGDCTWRLNGTKLTISGNGAMEDYDYWSDLFAPWGIDITSVVIEDGVTSIGGSAFYSCSSLTSVAIPDSVTSIGDDAFLDCNGLTFVTIGDSVTSIGSSAFGNCTGLTFITIPENVTSIGNYAFFGCSSLASVTIGNSVTSIGDDAFLYCYSLTSVVIGDSVTSIGDDAFWGCFNLISVTIPDSVTSIGDDAFYGCSRLTSVAIPDSVTSIGDAVFYGCSSLTSVTIPDSVTSIGNGAFGECTSLTSITIPDSVTSIGGAAFRDCSSLTSVAIPDSVTSIGDGPFSRCSGLTSISVSFANTAYSSLDGVLFNKDQTTLVCLPAEKSGAYTIPDSVTSIGDNAFDGCSSLTSITIPDSVTKIGVCAFSGCSSLTSVTIPDSVTSIGGAAFYECTKLTSITIPDSVTSIGRYAFDYCHNLTIHGYAGSTAKTYANENNIPFVTLAGKTLSIITQPKDVVVANGKTVKVTVVAEGDGLTYKWYYKDKGSSKFKLTTSFKGASYFVAMNAARSGRQVYCVITDEYGNSVTSDIVTISMKARIATQPKSVQVAKGKTAKITVKAEGEGLTYKWYYKDKGSSKFKLTTSFKGSSYSVQMTAARSGRQVYCVVTDKFGNQVTTKTVTLAQKVRIATQPKSVTVAKNKTAKITIKAEGEGLKYTWYIQNPGTNKFSKSSVKTSTYSVKMTSKVSGRKVYCKVTDKYGNTVASKTVSMKMK